MSSLRGKVLQGGGYLAIRRMAGSLMGLIGTAIITHRIGPANYGIYAAANSLLMITQIFATASIGTYIIRHRDEKNIVMIHQAFTLLIIFGLISVNIGFMLLPLIGEWVRLPHIELIMAALMPSLFLVLVSQVPQSLLERDLEFKKIMGIEMAGQAPFYFVAIPLAYLGFGVWSLVWAWWVERLVTLALFYSGCRYRPKLVWEPKYAWDMLRFSSSVSLAVLLGQGKSLVNPLIVARFLGAEAVAYVALISRVVEALSFIKTITARVAFAALAKIQDDPRRLLSAITDGMELQILAISPFLIGFALVANQVVPFMFGARWAPAIAIYGFVAFGTLVAATFSLHMAALRAINRNNEIWYFSLLYLMFYGASAWFLVLQFGLVGYGLAELTSLPSYWLLHVFLKRHVGQPRYFLTIILLLTSLPPLFYPQIGLVSVAGLFLPLVIPGAVAELRKIYTKLWEVMIPGNAK